MKTILACTIVLAAVLATPQAVAQTQNIPDTVEITKDQYFEIMDLHDESYSNGNVGLWFIAGGAVLALFPGVGPLVASAALNLTGLILVWVGVNKAAIVRRKFKRLTM